MSQWQTKWTKAQRDRCDFSKDGLFVVGVETAGGRYENCGVMDSAKASFLYLITGELYRGVSAQEAFDAAMSCLTQKGKDLVAVSKPWASDIRAGQPVAVGSDGEQTS